MLVLTRKCQEAIVVSGSDGVSILVKVTVLGIDRGKVRLGFEAAENIPVHRLEVWQRFSAIAAPIPNPMENSPFDPLHDIGGQG